MNSAEKDASNEALGDAIEQYEHLLIVGLPNGKPLPLRLQRLLEEQTRAFRQFGSAEEAMTNRERIDGIMAAIHDTISAASRTDSGDTLVEN